MSDSEEEDGYCVYGTPLEQLDEDEIPKKKINIEDQVATDEYGRRRFHGAFTGGFSAGFYNTVGSLEGWTPSTFKSSRSEKFTNFVHKPEDYMDEEDMGDFGIAPKRLTLTSDYASTSKNSKRKPLRYNDGPIPGQPVLQLLLETAKESVGVRLLKSMGWKPGQGVGPRLTKSEKKYMKKQHNQYSGKVYGCEIPEQFRHNQQLDSENSDSSDDLDSEITFAPSDYDPYIVKPKENTFGMGYSGLSKQTVLSKFTLFDEPSKFSMVETNNKKLSVTGQAFGVGAFEDDDEDIYSKEDMSHYDFALESVKELKSKKQLALPSTTPTILPGFVLSSNPIEKKKIFPPPVLPKNFIPIHNMRISRFEPLPDDRKPTENKSGQQKGSTRPNLNASDRTVIMREALTTLNKQSNDSQHENELIINKAKTITASLSQPSYDESGFKPFVSNPDKQRRYEEYLKLTKNGQKDKLTNLQPITMTEWEKDRERVEFEQASKMFRPINDLMFDKFVPAKLADDFSDPLAEVKKSQTDHGTEQMREAARLKMFGKLTREIAVWKPANLICKRFNVPVPSVGAADNEQEKKAKKYSVFDILEISQHNTPKILPIPDEPKNANVIELDSKEPQEISVQKGTEVTSADVQEPIPPTNLENSTVNSGKIEKIETVLAAKSEPSKLPRIQLPKPSIATEIPTDPDKKIDLFKAIFLSSSESEDSSENEESKEDKIAKMKEIVLENPIVTPAEKINTARNRSPSRGIFAGLDLDAINKGIATRDKILKEIADKKTDTKVENRFNETRESSESEDIYGPKLPSILVRNSDSEKASLNVLKNNKYESDNEWIEKDAEKTKVKNKHKNKKHKKGKEHEKHKKEHDKHKKKSKEKHKHKKHKSKSKHRHSDSD